MPSPAARATLAMSPDLLHSHRETRSNRCQPTSIIHLVALDMREAHRIRNRNRQLHQPYRPEPEGSEATNPEASGSPASATRTANEEVNAACSSPAGSAGVDTDSKENKGRQSAFQVFLEPGSVTPPRDERRPPPEIEAGFCLSRGTAISMVGAIACHGPNPQNDEANHNVMDERQKRLAMH